MLLLFLPTLLYNCTFAQQKKEMQDVLNVEKEISQAQVTSNIAEVEKLLAKDYTFTIPNGEIMVRQTFLDNMRESWKPLVVENTEQSVKFYGETAIVTGKARYRWKGENGEEECREQYTDTYVESKGEWYRASSHSSCLSGRCS